MPEKVVDKMEVDEKETPTTTSADGTPAEESKDVDAIALESKLVLVTQ